MNVGDEKQQLQLLIDWLAVLSNGYVKPDLSKDCCSNSTGVVRDTKKYFDHIDAINDKLATSLGVAVKQTSKRNHDDY